MDKLINGGRYGIKLIVFSLVFLVFGKRKPVINLGNKGANWYVPLDLFDQTSVVYSGGVGEDISFDLELIKKYHCHIHAFDPTPRSIKFAQKLKKLKHWYFYPWGIWIENKKIKFYQPKNKNDISASIVNLQKTRRFFYGQSKTIKKIMKNLRHEKIDLLKLDIEGAEEMVLLDILQQKIYPKVLCVELHNQLSINKIFHLISELRQQHYQLIKQDHLNFTFLYQ